MDELALKGFRERMAAEAERHDPPADFPKLPDMALARYTDHEVYAAEIEHIFRGTWQFAGRKSDYPTRGSYKVLDFPYAPVIVARGEDDVFRGFLNSCRHRGAPVVRDSEGTAKLFVCQFHSWSYNLCGELLRVPEERDFVGLDKNDRGLATLRVETWGELVFVNLEHDGPSLQEWLGPMGDVYNDLAAAPLRHIHQTSWDVSCNWKIVVEAFLEAYHVKTVHPEGALAVEARHTAWLLYPHGHSSVIAPFSEAMRETGFAELMWPEDIPQREELAHYKDIQAGFLVFPNAYLLADVSGNPMFSFWPIAPNRTRLRLDLYGVDWGEGDRPASWDLKVAQLEFLLGQDMANLEPIQRSIEAAAHGGIPLGYQERSIWHFNVAVDRQLGDAMPDHLRAPDLLSHLVEPA